MYSVQAIDVVLIQYWVFLNKKFTYSEYIYSNHRISLALIFPPMWHSMNLLFLLFWSIFTTTITVLNFLTVIS